MKRTVFAHILNEELLLPGWLHHHKKLFTDGVIIDCQSTDRSVEIVKEHCPHWKIVSIQAEDMYRLDIGIIQELEAQITGWKMALNISEYLIIDDLEQFLTQFELDYPNIVGLRSTGIIIVDRSGDHDLKQFTDLNIIKHKDFGYLEHGNAWNGQVIDGKYPLSDMDYRSRLLHKNVHGHYLTGRHNTALPVAVDPRIYVAWIGRGSPELYKYKLRNWINPPLGKSLWDNNDLNKGTEWYSEQGYHFWASEVQKSSNIFDTMPYYKQYINHLYK
jgi:hypothetical protein